VRARPHETRPLVAGGRRVAVDGHPICAGCGAAVVPVAAGTWRHGRDRPAFLTPVDRASTGLSYAEFGLRHPWAIDPAYGPVTSAAEWETARPRLAAYFTAFGTSSFVDLVRILAGRLPLGGWNLPPGLAQALDLPVRRRELAARYAWAIPSAGALAAIAEAGPVLEAGAGTGYWAALLRERGADVVATDPAAGGPNPYHEGPLWTEVWPLTGVAAVRAYPGRTLLLCWPPPEDDEAGYDVLRAYRGDVLSYVGGDADGPAGSPRFHRELALNWTVEEEIAIPAWPGLHDRLSVLRRNPVRRPHRTRDRCPECRRIVPTGHIGRCAHCVAARPAALTLRSGPHRVEYDAAALAAMHPALRAALESSPNRVGQS
jgi:hypothetical protein